MEPKIIKIQNLTVSVKQGEQSKNIVDKVRLSIAENSIVGLVGGSGSGKTTIGLSIIRLLASALKIDGGEILFEGYNLLTYSESKMREIRGKKIGMVFQEPLYAFNPVFRIGEQIDEVLRFHTRLDVNKRKAKVLELIDIVGLYNPNKIYQNYPHHLSGGMRQRAMIAQAIATEPKLLIADEPTSNLDVTIQAKIIELFRELNKKLNLSILLITHDLGVVSHLCDSIAVMTNGKIVETGKTEEVMKSPKDKYTETLLNCY
ncbi:MAG: ABC transporter ATP-binding protein [Candidatus Omnitrophica bacterium]|nr:ABC transporter ATP-binding protein [Candidatus Omnitrophota bacterium]MBU1995548.1 ABC transporter ATP-binding protein [Candidatus Omnitrophota bacterium]MBU4333477.1 ABC transporter ATP-binding protein [Candidatus Omnitrophota bacterium]